MPMRRGLPASGVGTADTRHALEIVTARREPVAELLDTLKTVPAVDGGVPEKTSIASRRKTPKKSPGRCGSSKNWTCSRILAAAEAAPTGRNELDYRYTTRSLVEVLQEPRSDSAISISAPEARKTAHSAHCSCCSTRSVDNPATARSACFRLAAHRFFDSTRIRGELVAIGIAVVFVQDDSAESEDIGPHESHTEVRDSLC